MDKDTKFILIMLAVIVILAGIFIWKINAPEEKNVKENVEISADKDTNIEESTLDKIKRKLNGEKRRVEQLMESEIFKDENLWMFFVPPVLVAVLIADMGPYMLTVGVIYIIWAFIEAKGIKKLEKKGIDTVLNILRIFLMVSAIYSIEYSIGKIFYIINLYVLFRILKKYSNSAIKKVVSVVIVEIIVLLLTETIWNYTNIFITMLFTFLPIYMEAIYVSNIDFNEQYIDQLRDDYLQNLKE